MNSSAEIDKLATALIAAKKEFLPALKTAYNPHYKSKYVDLAGVTEATDASLAKHDLVLVQSPGGEGQSISVTSRLIHSSGQWIEGTFTLPAATGTRFDAQTACGAVTYARRYSYMGLLGIAPEDDDGNAASGKQEVKQEVRELKPKDIEDIPDDAFFAEPIRELKTTKKTTTAGVNDATGEAAISEGKAKRFWAISLGKGKSKTEIAAALAAKGLSDIKNCPWKGKTYEELVEWAGL